LVSWGGDYDLLTSLGYGTQFLTQVVIPDLDVRIGENHSAEDGPLRNLVAVEPTDRLAAPIDKDDWFLSHDFSFDYRPG